MTFFCSASFLKVPLYMSYEKRIYKIVGTFQKLYGTEYFNAKTNIMTCLSLCGSATSFTLRRFGAQINWRDISRKNLVEPHRLLSKQSLINFAGDSGNGITFLNGKRHVKKMDIDRHGPRLIPNNCRFLDPPYFSLPTTFTQHCTVPNRTKKITNLDRKLKKQCCGSGSGIRCLYEPWIRDPEYGFSESRISDPKPIFLRA
jgi:hypothetical protein